MRGPEFSKFGWVGAGAIAAVLLIGGPRFSSPPVLAAKAPPQKSVLAGKARKVSRKANLRPLWVRKGVAQQDPNASYLGRLEMAEPGFDIDDVLSPKKVSELRQEYEFLSRSHELRRQADLVDPVEEQKYVEQMRTFTKRVFTNVRQHRVRESAKSIRESLSSAEDLKTPVMVAAAITAASTGTPIQALIDEDMHLTAAANLPYQTSYLQLSSPILNGTISVAGNANSNAAMLAPPPPDWLPRGERYWLGVSSPVGFWDLGSGLSYGGSSSNLSASLTKPITPQLRAELGRKQPLASGGVPEETFKVNYELRF